MKLSTSIWNSFDSGQSRSGRFSFGLEFVNCKNRRFPTALRSGKSALIEIQQVFHDLQEHTQTQ